MMDSKEKSKLIEELFEKGILANEDLLEKEDETIHKVFEKIESESDLLVLNSDYLTVMNQSNVLIDWYEVDAYKVDAEKRQDDELYQTQLQTFKRTSLGITSSPHEEIEQQVSNLETVLDESNKKTSFSTQVQSIKSEPENISNEEVAHFSQTPSELIQPSSSIVVVTSFQNVPKKYEIKDFTNFFLSRYKFLEKILRNRSELKHTIAINRALEKKERETVSIIGLVDEIGETRNGNLMLTIEDPTGSIKVFISKNNKELYRAAKDLVVDEVIGISGSCGDKIIFTNSIVWPDVPRHNELKRGPNEEFVIFLSDIHVGSSLFLQTEFERFLRWIRGEAGNEEQRSIAQKVKYVIIAGDLVDGIGIYPSQHEELSITTIDGQYKEFARLISQIPKHIEIIICPGNHDVVHLAEPQPAFYQEFSPELFTLPNVILVTNPSMVTVGKTQDFEGFNILLYHGYSFDYYVANVESIRMNGGYHRADLIMKFLLKRRHLAPSFKSTPYYPSHKEDPLLIRKIPDIFITGHIHYSSVANYHGVTMISGSCWQAKTSFQEKLGHEPEPARVPVVNLKTREIKVLRFG